LAKLACNSFVQIKQSFYFYKISERIVTFIFFRKHEAIGTGKANFGDFSRDQTRLL